MIDSREITLGLISQDLFIVMLGFIKFRIAMLEENFKDILKRVLLIILNPVYKI